MTIYSVGFDRIDLAVASGRGIAVLNPPGVPPAAARRATVNIDLLVSGRWKGQSPGQLNGVGLAGETLGILGWAIQAVGSRPARAFGMQIAHHNPKPSRCDNALLIDDPHRLNAESDVLLLAWPSKPETRQFIDAHTLGLAKPEPILVNIGSGDPVCDEDLIDALPARRIFAADLDVFDGGLASTRAISICPTPSFSPTSAARPGKRGSAWRSSAQMGSARTSTGIVKQIH